MSAKHGTIQTQKDNIKPKSHSQSPLLKLKANLKMSVRITNGHKVSNPQSASNFSSSISTVADGSDRDMTENGKEANNKVGHILFLLASTKHKTFIFLV